MQGEVVPMESAYPGYGDFTVVRLGRLGLRIEGLGGITVYGVGLPGYGTSLWCA